MAASLSGGICSLVHLGSHLPRVVHYLLGPRRHLSVRASSDTAFLPAPTPFSVLCASRALSGAPSVSLSSCLTCADPVWQPSALFLGRSSTLVLLCRPHHRWRWKNWDAESWLGLCWHIPACWVQGLALSGSGPAVLCPAPDLPGGELDYSLKSGTEMYFFFFLTPFGELWGFFIVEVIITQLHIYSYYI